ncbi:TonB-dependent receptor domain-containing protein [Erythrobacter sp. THAF29]|uniref:TonB-dependent receptor domain-containing protein n=1 Tax=Erythrobacter sp. THAF29 TaxID=2587851 RepID=UPI0012683C3E|nr:TonB-dependent receptor [Erythrobacter sp. THAF29]QFT78605.1 Vitamin B12 transporter BtuB [Erythrobacter sp. THAF29]
MSTGTRLAGLLLLTTSLTFPAAAFAQSSDPQEVEETEDGQIEDAETVQEEDTAEQPEISVPGGGIIVTGRRNRNPERSSTQVLNVLSEADIARTGEGDIAGALGRVTGLSVVGDGRVFVRGLGDRYSLALLNGLPLPSPEPLSRVVPLDIFPTNVVASSLVQKTYSANYPGEFGGGVINLTTKAVPVDDFLTISLSTGGDTETTFENGLTYFGSDWDSFGFDNGNRDIPSNLQAFLDSGERIGTVPIEVSEGIAGQLMPLNLVTLQKVPQQRVNLSGSLTGGASFELGEDTYLGLIATASIKNSLRNRTVVSQGGSSDLSELFQDFRTFITDESILVNGLIGLGLDIGPHTIRWTNLYIRDTLKTARLEEGTDILPGFSGFDFQNQQTAWFERQLIDTQLVAELEFGRLGVDLRGGYARTDREAPFNTNVSYTRTNIPGDPYGEFFVAYFNQLSDAGITTVSFDDLREELWFGGLDLSYELFDSFEVTVGGAYSDTTRRSSSREFRPFISGDVLPDAIVPALGLRRPGDIINGATLAGFDVTLTEASPFPVFDAGIEIKAGYGLFRWLATDTLTLEAGVRYEEAEQVVALDQTIFNTPIAGATPTNLNNDYFLPGGTITWEPVDDLQLRLSASQTIARPQFRELVEQTYFDPDSNRRFRGNPLLNDSELINIEARAEYYLGGPNRVSLAGFFKEIDNPIENTLVSASGQVLTSFANAPSANLYGAELDLVYGFDLYNLGGSFFETKQLLFLANYTYTQSEISVGPDDISPTTSNPNQLSSLIFDDGAPLVGQSDHVANFSIGIEDTEKTQQLTVLVNYASERVTLRGGALPDVVEDPGVTVDIVARTDVALGGVPLELSFEARNILGRDNFEFQQLGDNRIEINTYEVGTSFSFGVKAEF